MFWPTVPLLLVCVALGSCQPAANVEFDKILADIAMGRATIDPNVVSPSPISHFGQLESSDLYKGDHYNALFMFVNVVNYFEDCHGRHVSPSQIDVMWLTVVGCHALLL